MCVCLSMFNTYEQFHRFGKVPQDFRMDDLKCTGKEKNVRECPHKRCDNCGSMEGAGVICKGNTNC